MTRLRTPALEELPVALQQASPDEQLALREFAAWAHKHHAVFVTGRRHGLRFGVTPDVAEFVRQSCPAPADGAVIAANLVPLPR